MTDLPNPLIVYENVTKEYAFGYKSLDNVSLKIHPGEFVFIIGPSGAGKSTLVKMLFKEEVPTSGSILFEGKNLNTISHKDIPAIRRKIGVVFQDFKVLNSRNVFDNVAVALEVVYAERKVIEQIVPNVLALVGLSEKMFVYPTTLSGGEKQRLAIARALAHEPDVLVADEPTGMVDPKSTDQIVEILDKINKLGTTVVMATHDQRVVDKMKKRVIRMEKGQIIEDTKGGKYHAAHS